MAIVRLLNGYYKIDNKCFDKSGSPISREEYDRMDSSKHSPNTPTAPDKVIVPIFVWPADWPRCHPVTQLSDLLQGEEYETFLAGIKRGYRKSLGNIVTTPGGYEHGEILDGRDRYRAHMDLGLPPPEPVIETGDPWLYGLDANFNRKSPDKLHRQKAVEILWKKHQEAATERKKQLAKKTNQKLGRKTETDICPLPLGPAPGLEVSVAIGKALNCSEKTIRRDIKDLKLTQDETAAQFKKSGKKKKSPGAPKSKATMTVEEWLEVHPEDDLPIREFKRKAEACGYTLLLKS